MSAKPTRAATEGIKKRRLRREPPSSMRENRLGERTAQKPVRSPCAPYTEHEGAALIIVAVKGVGEIEVGDQLGVGHVRDIESDFRIGRDLSEQAGETQAGRHVHLTIGSAIQVRAAWFGWF